MAPWGLVGTLPSPPPPWLPQLCSCHPVLGTVRSNLLSPPSAPWGPLATGATRIELTPPPVPSAQRDITTSSPMALCLPAGHKHGPCAVTPQLRGGGGTVGSASPLPQTPLCLQHWEAAGPPPRLGTLKVNDLHHPLPPPPAVAQGSKCVLPPDWGPLKAGSRLLPQAGCSGLPAHSTFLQHFQMGGFSGQVLHLPSDYTRPTSLGAGAFWSPTHSWLLGF